MKAISIPQPYASLAASKETWIESRRWPTSYRGPIAIHASGSLKYLDRQGLREYPSGCILAIGRLAASVREDAIRAGNRWECRIIEEVGVTREDFLANQWATGPWCFVIQEISRLSVPVMAKGSTQLWDWEPPQ